MKGRGWDSLRATVKRLTIGGHSVCEFNVVM